MRTYLATTQLAQGPAEDQAYLSYVRYCRSVGIDPGPQEIYRGVCCTLLPGTLDFPSTHNQFDHRRYYPTKETIRKP